MATIKETIRAEIERLKAHTAKCGYPGQIEFADGNREGRNYICNKLLAFLDTLSEQPKDDKEQNVNLPKWQKLKNIDSYSNRKIWKDDRVLFVVDGEGYLYMCPIRELFDKLPKEE